MLFSEWIYRSPQITEANKDHSTNSDLYKVQEKMVLTSVGIYHKSKERTTFDPFQTNWKYEYDHYAGGHTIRIKQYDYSAQYREANVLKQSYLPKITFFIVRGSQWLQLFDLKKESSPYTPYRETRHINMVLLPNDRLYTIITWPKIVIEGNDSNPIPLTTQQQRQFNQHIGDTMFMLQGVYV